MLIYRIDFPANEYQYKYSRTNVVEWEIIFPIKKQCVDNEVVDCKDETHNTEEN